MFLQGPKGEILRRRGGEGRGGEGRGGEGQKEGGEGRGRKREGDIKKEKE